MTNHIKTVWPEYCFCAGCTYTRSRRLWIKVHYNEDWVILSDAQTRKFEDIHSRFIEAPRRIIEDFDIIADIDFWVGK